jgi:N-acetylglutamate synthase-like GNAT family acetyltransferase
MDYQDKSIQCSDCGTIFTFTAGEQEFFASKGFTNAPKRCPQCRQAKKRETGSYSRY